MSSGHNMIEIICDQYELCQVTEADSVVTDTDQFEDELVKIRRNSETGESLRIIVRSQILFRHFDAAIKYGTIKRVLDPVTMLADALGQTVVPKYLQAHPEWIVELDLLGRAKTVQAAKGETIDNWLKINILGDVWAEYFSDSQEALSSLFAYFTERDAQALHPLEKRLVNEHLHKWHLENPGRMELLSWLQEDPFQRTKFIIWEQQLLLFPEHKVSDWLQQDEIWFALSKFPNRSQLPRLASSLQLPEKIAAFARDFLLDKWQISPEEALPFISGQLNFETNFLQEQLGLLLRAETAISALTYEGLLSLNIPAITSLAKQLIPVEPPTVLSAESSVIAVQEWLEDEYLTFYNSCSLLGKLDETEPYIADFEKWLLQHYNKEMLFSGEGMAYRQISELKSCDWNVPVLMVVFDGLDYLCAREELLPVMQDNGLFPLNKPIPFFSFLPSQTAIAKPVLVAGKMKSQLPDEKPNAVFYKELLRDSLGLSGDDIRSKVDKDGSLLELIQEPAKIYLYLDNQLDREYLHSNLRQYSRKQKYREYIRQRAEEIINCIRDFRNMYGKSLKIAICSDHGYTIIPQNAEVIKISAGEVGKTRTLSGYKAEYIADIPAQHVWKLHPALYGLNEEVILPRGYSCFKSRPLGATHGGCSPQEMAVPWFLLSTERPLAIEPLGFSIEGEIFRKRAANNLVLHIANQNKYQVTLVVLDITGITLSTDMPIRIPPAISQKLQVSFNAAGINKDNVQFVIYYHIKCEAGELDERIIITKPTKGSMSTDFDDDFDI